MSKKFVFPIFVFGTIAVFWEGCASKDDQKEKEVTTGVKGAANTGTSSNSLSPEKEGTTPMTNEEIFQKKYDITERLLVELRDLVVKTSDDEESFKATEKQSFKLFMDAIGGFSKIHKMYPGYLAEEAKICMQYIEKVAKDEIDPAVESGSLDDEQLIGTLRDALLKLQILGSLTGTPGASDSPVSALKKYMGVINDILTGKFQQYKQARMIMERLELFVSVVFSSDKNVLFGHEYLHRVLRSVVMSGKRALSAIGATDSIGKDTQTMHIPLLFEIYQKGFSGVSNYADYSKGKNEKVLDSEAGCLSGISEVFENPDMDDEQVKNEIKKIVDQSVLDLTRIGSEDSSALEGAKTAEKELKKVLDKFVTSLESKKA